MYFPVDVYIYMKTEIVYQIQPFIVCILVKNIIKFVLSVQGVILTRRAYKFRYCKARTVKQNTVHKG